MKEHRPTPEVVSPRERGLDAQVEDLARRLVAAVNDASPEQRPGLREYALELLREGTEGTDQSAARRASVPAPAAGSNPIGIALLLGIVALPALLLFTPVGLVLLVVALVLGVWGVVTTLRRP